MVNGLLNTCYLRLLVWLERKCVILRIRHIWHWFLGRLVLCCWIFFWQFDCLWGWLWLASLDGIILLAFIVLFDFVFQLVQLFKLIGAFAFKSQGLFGSLKRLWFCKLGFWKFGIVLIQLVRFMLALVVWPCVADWLIFTLRLI